MEMIDFQAGNLDRFDEFVKSIKENDRVAVLSHDADLDGLVSAKITSEFFHTKDILLIGYGDLNSNLVEKIRQLGVNVLIFTDLSVDDRNFFNLFDSSFKILSIDHHLFDFDYNSENVVFMNAQGYCAAFLSYYLFSRFKNLEDLDWLIACASLSDWAYFKNVAWMAEVYKKYGVDFVADPDEVTKGKIWDLVSDLSLALIYYRSEPKFVFNNFGKNFGDIGNLRENIDIVKQAINAEADRFEKEKKEINGRFVFEVISKYAIRESLINRISHKMPNKTFIFWKRTGDVYNVSSRRQDGGENLNDLMKRLVEGFENSSAGGHFKASGANFPAKYLEEFRKRLEVL